MKKGQVMGQVFIYIITALIIGVVLLFGVQAIMKLVKTSNDVRVATFQNGFVERLEADSDHEALDTEPIKIPGEFSEICFLDMVVTPPATGCNSPPATMPTKYAVIKNSWQDCVQQNIFLIGSSKMKSMYVKGLRVKDLTYPTRKYLCEPIKAGIVTTLQFRGLGSGVTVEK